MSNMKPIPKTIVKVILLFSIFISGCFEVKYACFDSKVYAKKNDIFIESFEYKDKKCFYEAEGL